MSGESCLLNSKQATPEHQHVLHQTSAPQNLSTMTGVLAHDGKPLSVAQYGLVCFGPHHA